MGTNTVRCESIVDKCFLGSIGSTHKHSAEWVVLKTPSCYERGLKVYKCSECGTVFDEEELYKVNHEYVNNVCKYCYGVINYDPDNYTILIDSDICIANGISLYGDVTIPEYVYYEGERYQVVGIRYAGFNANSNIASVQLPDSVHYIGDFAFNDCVNMRSMHIPSDIKYVGYASFQCCYKLDKIAIPNSAEYIGDFAYNHLSGAGNTSITIPKSVMSIGSNSKYPAHAFYDSCMDGFTEFRVEDGSNYYCSIDGVLYTKDGSTLVSIPRGKTFSEDTYVMPNTVKNLGELSFSRNRNIKNVVISDNLVVNGKMNNIERSTYLSYGNDLSIAIYNYSEVENYLVNHSNKRYKSIDGILYSIDGTKVVAIPSHYNGYITIPEGVTTWKYEAIWANEDVIGLCFENIKGISIPSTMVKINDKQLEFINKLVDRLGIDVSVSEENTVYTVTNGYLSYK